MHCNPQPYMHECLFAILFLCHPYIGAHYRLSLIVKCNVFIVLHFLEDLVLYTSSPTFCSIPVILKYTLFTLVIVLQDLSCRTLHACMSVYIDEAVATDQCVPFTSVQYYALTEVSPFVADTAAHADYQTTIATEKQQIQEDLDTVKHMTQAKDQQISVLEQELMQAKLVQKCKWRCNTTDRLRNNYT